MVVVYIKFVVAAVGAVDMCITYENKRISKNTSDFVSICILKLWMMRWADLWIGGEIPRRAVHKTEKVRRENVFGFEKYREKSAETSEAPEQIHRMCIKVIHKQLLKMWKTICDRKK